jgi:DNA-binding GntR family transcriptional regulator
VTPPPTDARRLQIKPSPDIKTAPAAKRRRRPVIGGAEAAALPRGEYAYVSLRGAIRAGQLTPGQRVRETEIAEWLGISRTPVREALMRLEAAGLVQSASHSGFVVNRLDNAEVRELYAMREVLEGMAARLAAQHASDTEILTLRKLLEQHATARADAERLAAINLRIHRTIYEAAHNRFLLGALNALSDSLALLGETTYRAEGRGDSAHREHGKVVDAIEARDADAAESAAREHIRESREVRLAMMFDDLESTAV